jgi:HK97 family phage portal protein
MLNYDISPAMSKWVMMKTVVAKMLLDGNAYMVIKRPIDMGDPTSLELVNDIVKIYQRDDGTVYYEIERPGDKPYRVDGQDMIHIPNFTYDGINGVSTLRHAANTLALAYYSESTAKGFFSSGANMAGILQVEGRLDKDKADGIKESWRKAFNINSGEPGGIAVMEGGLTFTPVTINPKDAQMLETRQYNVVDICRFFGVHPSKVFDDKNLTYSNIESFQLGFYTDTIGPLNSKIEAEFNRKLLRPGKRRTRKFNLNMDELLKANLDAKSNYYRKMLETGAISPNEIADKIGMPKVKGGDKRYVPMNLIPVDAPITQNKQIDKNININGKGDKDNTE